MRDETFTWLLGLLLPIIFVLSLVVLIRQDGEIVEEEPVKQEYAEELGKTEDRVKESNKTEEGNGIEEGETEDKSRELALMVVQLTVAIFLVYIVMTVIIFLYEFIRKKHEKYRDKKELEQKKSVMGYCESRVIDETIIYNINGRLRINSFYLEVLKKLNEINEAYSRNKESLGVSMYKYRETFEKIHWTIRESDRVGLSDSEEVKSIIEKVLNYPYNEIVKDSGIRDVTEGLEEELRILEGLEKLRGEE